MPSGFEGCAVKVPIGSTTFAKLGNNKTEKLEKRTMTQAFAILSKPLYVCVIENIANMAANAAPPRVGSTPRLGNVFANNEPAWTTPKARKQLLLTRLAAAIRFPAVLDFSASSTKSLKLDGTSQSEHSCRLMATSASSRPEMRLYKYIPMNMAVPWPNPTPPTASVGQTC